MTSKTARISAERHPLEDEVRRLDAAISAEGAGIAWHQERIEDHEAEQERLGGELHEAVVRLAAASAESVEGRLAAFNRIVGGLRNDYATVEKVIDFADPPAWRRAPSDAEQARLDAEAEHQAMLDYLDSGAPIVAAVSGDD